MLKTQWRRCFRKKGLTKQEYQTRKNQALTNLNPKISRKLNRLLNSNLEDEIERFLLRASEPTDTETESYFKVGLLVRYPLSCLIDADRTDAANFESGQSIINKTNSKKIKWKVLIEVRKSYCIFQSGKGNRSPSQRCFPKVFAGC